jgi:hypothetical protein
LSCFVAIISPAAEELLSEGVLAAGELLVVAVVAGAAAAALVLLEDLLLLPQPATRMASASRAGATASDERRFTVTSVISRD